MAEFNPYEAPQESGTLSTSAEHRSNTSSGGKWLLVGGAFVSQFVLMGLFFWSYSPGRIPGASPFAILGIGAIAFFFVLSLFITAVVRRSWTLAIVQVFVFVGYLFILMVFM